MVKSHIAARNAVDRIVDGWGVAEVLRACAERMMEEMGEDAANDYEDKALVKALPMVKRAASILAGGE